MIELDRDKDTICAISTATGSGGIAVIRVSGNQAVKLAKKICPFLPPTPMSHHIYYGWIRDLDSKEYLDEVLVSFFEQGRSFTSEPTIEISCHGGHQISQQILEQLVKLGARTADRGEFTYRAFMHGRLDLVQAESVLNLIESHSKLASRQALRNLKGKLSSVYQEVENELIKVLANLEANIDFSSEDIVIASTEEISEKLKMLLNKVQSLLQSYTAGKALSDSCLISIVGEPNVGKSSLLNSVLNEDKAIVTEVAGTTRDPVEGLLQVDGMRYRFIDTAGLRDTSDKVEAIGIRKTKEIVSESDYILHVVDIRNQVALKALQNGQVDFASDAPKILVLNKRDLVSAKDIEVLESIQFPGYLKVFCVSAIDNQSSQKLIDFIGDLTKSVFVESQLAVTSARHFELLKKIFESLRQAQIQAQADASPEFVAFEMRDALYGVHELLGKQYDDQVMDRVFKEFCLGK